MAEEEVVAPAASPVPSDNKRKLEDLQTETTEQRTLDENADNADNADAPVSGETESKRPRLDDQHDGLGTVFVKLFCNSVIRAMAMAVIIFLIHCNIIILLNNLLFLLVLLMIWL